MRGHQFQLYKYYYFSTWNGEPNNRVGNEQCTMMLPGGRYADKPCTYTAHYLCQKSADLGTGHLFEWDILTTSIFPFHIYTTLKEILYYAWRCIQFMAYQIPGRGPIMLHAFLPPPQSVNLPCMLEAWPYITGYASKPVKFVGEICCNNKWHNHLHLLTSLSNAVDVIDF